MNRKLLTRSVVQNYTKRAGFFLRLSITSVHTLGLVGGAKLLAANLIRKDFLIRPKVCSFDLWVRGKTSDAEVLHKIFVRKEYPVLAQDSVSLIIDAGANVGYSTVFFALEYPHATVIAVEPELRNFKALERNTKHLHNVQRINAAVWHRNSRLALQNKHSLGWDFQVAEANVPGEVSSITMNELITAYQSRPGPVLAKMDIEGAERFVFAKDNSWLRRINYLLIEIHDAWKEVFDALSAYNYQARMSGENLVVQINHK